MSEFVYHYTRIPTKGKERELFTTEDKLSYLSMRPPSCILVAGDVENIYCVGKARERELLLNPGNVTIHNYESLALNKKATEILRNVKGYENSWCFVFGEVFLLEEDFISSRESFRT